MGKDDILERIEIRQGDITTLRVDAIVNAANSSLRGGGGVDGAIHRAAGPGLLAECRTIGGCPAGEARITRGYDLPAAHVIHTVGPVYSGQAQDSLLLASCYRKSLELAVDHDIHTLAFPAVSCGVYGYPIQEACQIALNTTLDFLAADTTLTRVLFVLFSSRDADVYRACLEARNDN